MFNLLLKIAFFYESRYLFSEEEISVYNNLIEKTDSGLIEYDCPFPKSRFVAYLSQSLGFLIHGTNKKDIENFQPFKQTLYNGQIVEAVFATRDSIWPVFFVILNRSKINKSIRNACIYSNKGNFYFFSLSEAYRSVDPWTEGMLYFLPAKTFQSVKKGLLKFDEWVSYESVKPIYKLPVSKYDFIYLDRITYHKPTEPVLKSWFLYKSRIKKGIRYDSANNIK
jgi:hypothetical protein